MLNHDSIAIIGTVGIPASYGGFETLTENLVKYLPGNISITVFCSSKAYDNLLSSYNGAKLQYIGLNANGVQSILYDVVSLFKAAKQCDVILILGVSGCIVLPFFRFFYPKKKLIINIDGLEHKRAKWSKLIKRFLKLSEKAAVRYGNEIIADNKAIQQYIKKEYGKESRLIAYGGDHVKMLPLSVEIKQQYSLPDRYAFEVCRIEPENNINLILEAFSKSTFPLVIIGNWDYSDYGRKLRREYSEFKNIIMLNAIYDQDILDQIRSNCYINLHGYSAGGTNPSLVEAMYLSLPVFAFDVVYNRETTFNKAKYFKNVEGLLNLLNNNSDHDLKKSGTILGKLAKEHYTWKKIAEQYEEVFNVFA